MHYFEMPSCYWRDILRASSSLRALALLISVFDEGLSAVVSKGASSVDERFSQVCVRFCKLSNIHFRSKFDSSTRYILTVRMPPWQLDKYLITTSRCSSGIFDEIRSKRVILVCFFHLTNSFDQ